MISSIDDEDAGNRGRRCNRGRRVVAVVSRVKGNPRLRTFARGDTRSGARRPRTSGAASVPVSKARLNFGPSDRLNVVREVAVE